MSYSSKFNRSAPPWTSMGSNDHRLWLFPVKPQGIYLAASMPEQAATSRFALQLIDAGFKVTSSWLRQDFSDKPDQGKLWSKYAEYEAKWGATDLADLQRADTLVVLANEPSSSGGYWCELGYFLGTGRENVVFVGDRRNVFAYADAVRWAPNTAGLINWLQDGRHGAVAPAPLSKFYSTVQEVDDSPTGLLSVGYQSPPTDTLTQGMLRAASLQSDVLSVPTSRHFFVASVGDNCAHPLCGAQLNDPIHVGYSPEELAAAGHKTGEEDYPF
jgi:hypothetical protein